MIPLHGLRRPAGRSLRWLLASVAALASLAAHGDTTAADLEDLLRGIPEREQAAILNEEANRALEGSPELAVELAERALSLADRHGDDETAAAALTTLGSVHFQRGDLDRAAPLFEQSLERARRAGAELVELRALNYLGVIERKQSRYQSSLQRFHAMLAILDRADRPTTRALTFNNIGSNYYYMGDLDRALEFFLRALRIREGLDDRADVAESLNNVAVIYDELKQSEKALEYYQQSLAIFEELGDMRRIVDPLNNIGTLYYTYYEDHDRAEPYHLRALQLRRELGDRSGEAVSLNNLGNLARAREDIDGALRHYRQALAIREELDDRAGMTVSLRDIGDLLREEKRYDEALDHFERAVIVAEEIGARNDMRRVYQDLATLYEEKGEYRQALAYAQKFHELDDEIRGEEASRAVAELQTRYEIEKKEKEIETLRQQTELQGRAKYFFIATIVLILAVTVLVFHGYRVTTGANRLLVEKNEQIEHQKGRLEALNEVLEARSEEYYISSIMDGLTETYNKAYILDVITKAFSLSQRHHQRLACVFIDLDNFKQINDTHGHIVGDRVLQGVASAIKGQIRTEDALGRYGGEEFLLILPNTSVKGATMVAEKIRSSIEKVIFSADGKAIGVTISAGVAELKAHSPINAEELLRQADTALYAAKSQGRNRTVLFSEVIGGVDLSSG